MKQLITTILIIACCFFSIADGYSQSKSNTDIIEWINTEGEEIIKEITSNSSIYWELDEYGSFRITNYNPGKNQPEKRSIVKQYTYLNLYELDPEGILLKQNSDSEKTAVLVLTCQKGKENCFKVRKYFTKTNFQTNTNSVYKFQLKNPQGFKKAEKLQTHLSILLHQF